MGKVTQNVAVIQSRHRDFGYYHLQEGRERREDTEFIWSEAKSSSSRVVSAFHDPRWNEHLGVLLVNDFQTSRSLQITYGSSEKADAEESCQTYYRSP